MAERPDPHANDGMVGPHGQPTDHGDDGGHDDHAHGGEELGPIDVMAWGFGAVGIVLGLLVAAAFLAAAG